MGVLLILILSLGLRAGEVIKIVQLGMALATKWLYTNDLLFKPDNLPWSLFVLCLSCCHVFGWTEKEEWNGKVPGKITVHCSVTGPGSVPLRLSSLSFCFTGLWPYLEWANMERRMQTTCTWSVTAHGSPYTWVGTEARGKPSRFIARNCKGCTIKEKYKDVIISILWCFLWGVIWDE